MLRILIADDEYPVRMGLRKCIDWEAHGVFLMGFAEDGPDAYSMISEMQPDIAFLDIQMPGMNGLEVIRSVHGLEIHQPCFIIISGYDSFDYAKSAISLGVTEYILKPFRPMDIFTAIYKSFVQIPLLRNALLGLGLDLNKNGLLNSLDFAMPVYPHEEESALIHALLEKDIYQCSKAFAVFQNAVRINNSQEQCVLYCYSVLLYTILSLVQRKALLSDPLSLLPEHTGTYCLEKLVDTIFPMVVENSFVLFNSTGEKNAAVHHAIEYIDEHYREELTLGDIADHVGLAPAYLSSLFTKVIGISITDYIQKKRLDDAMKLLLQSSLYVREIAEKVGYPNEKYFCRVFKAKLGVTAREFRNQHSSKKHD